MKPKISPEEYKKILNSIELELITMTESKTKYQPEYIDNDLDVSIKGKPKFRQIENRLTVNYRFNFKGKSSIKEKPGIEILGVYQIIYTKKDKAEIPENFFEPFSQFIVELMIWTYFREFVQSSISRMNLPTFTLPFKRI